MRRPSFAYTCVSSIAGHYLKAVLIVSAFSSPSSGYAQGWINVTPPALTSIHRFQSFDFADSSFEVFVWNSDGEESRGYRMTEDAQWDSILVYTSNWCGIGSYDTRTLLGIGRSFEDPTRAFSIFGRGGCIVECYTYLYSDTTGSIGMENERLWFDDISCAGRFSKVAVSPADDHNVFFVFSDSLYYSSDRGETFEARSTPMPEWSILDFLAVSPHDAGVVFVGAYGSPVFRSNDTGNAWTAVLEEEISPIKFSTVDPALLFTTGTDGVLKSTDLGETWENILTGDFRCVEIKKDDSSEVFAGSAAGEIYRSTDGGINWHIYNNTFSQLPVNDLFSMPDCDTLVVGTSFGVFKVYDSFLLDIEEQHTNVPGRFELHQNYPNPFNPSTTIRFEIPDGGVVNLSVFDLLGREIATLVNEKLDPGSHAREWDAGSVPSAVYFYRLISNGFSRTKQMVLIK